MRPNVLWGRDGIQLSFDLPYRISNTCIYPQRPSNGSHVIICAHNEGIRVIWYAGKRLKERSVPVVNGNSIDLTEDDEDVAEYEQEEQEVDPARPFHNILGYKDIQLDSAATKLAVPPHSLARTDDFHNALDTNALVAVGCADFSIRLLRIPLQFDKRDDEVQQVTISGSDTHQDLISDLAITITASLLGDGDARTGRTISHSDGRDARESTRIAKEWSILVASTSPTGTGLLLIHRIPLDNDGHISGDVEDCAPVQRRFLRCSLAKCHLEFNPSLYPSHRHSYLLVAPGDGSATKIYQTLSGPQLAKKRRGSTNTIDSTASVNQSTRRSPLSDRLLIDLLSPFHDRRNDTMSPARKSVLDARWVLHGRAVMALLNDGDWGVWDVEAAGPSTSISTANLVKAKSDISGIQGGSISKFAIQGSVISTTSSKPYTSNGTQSVARSSLAPMTPHTRKQRSEGLFKAKDQDLESRRVLNPAPKHGNLAILVRWDKRTTRSQDESVVLSYGSSNTFIPSLQACWRSDETRAGSFNGSAVAKPVLLPNLQLAGELPQSIHLIPTVLTDSADSLFITNRIIQNFLVSTPSRLVLFVAPLTENSAQTQATTLQARLLTASSTNQDQMLLDSGELDVDGMDRILDSMAGSGMTTQPTSVIPFNSVAKKSVGFNFGDEDEDVTMESPTTSKSSRTRLTVNDQQQKQHSTKRLVS